ncbi:MAG: hypothetical protein V1898_05165 [Patescibacteria group bacterium]
MILGITEEKVNKFLNEYYKYLAILIIVIIIGVSFFTMLWPKYKDLQDNGILEHKQAMDLLVKRQQYLNKLQIMKDEYEKIQYRAWQNFQYVLPSDNDLYLLFAQMEILANENDLLLTSISYNPAISQSELEKAVAPAPVEQALPENFDASDPMQGIEQIAPETTVKKQQLEQVYITLNLEGLDSYEKFKNFLDNLESDLRIFNVESLTYDPNQTAYSLTLTTYYLANVAQ